MTNNDAYEQFVEHYKKFLEAKQRAKQATSTEDPEARESARAFALQHAYSNIPEIKEALDDEAGGEQTRERILSDQRTVDKYLMHAQLHNRQLAEGTFENDRQAIYDGAPRKGLAKLSLDAIPPVEMSGSDARAVSHNESAQIHQKYLTLGRMLSQEGDKAVSHEELYKVAQAYIAERVQKRIQENELLKGNEQYVALTLDLALSPYRLSAESTRGFLANRMKEHKKEFDKVRPTDEDKSRYALENIDLIAEENKDVALQLLYLASEAAKKDEDEH